MPSTGHFVLHSSVLPPMTAGGYELVSAQSGTPFTVNTEHTSITVASPRYTMPHDQILSSFPPANAEGAFGDRLPQIVLKRRTLPWERNPTGAIEVSTTPWLALVVVAEGEAELVSPAAVADCVTPQTPLLDPDDRDVDQSAYLAVTETVVRKIFPCEEDLALLTHVREVDVNDTELANGDDDGWLAVVLANRLPVFDTATGQSVRYMACLVNLEGQLPALPPPSPPVDDFVFEKAQDWSVLAGVTADADLWVSGGALTSAVNAEILLPGDVARAVEFSQDAARLPNAGAALDGAATAATSSAASAASTWSVMTPQAATAAISAAANDRDASLLVRDTMKVGFKYPISLYAAEKVLRFPVLAHWTFTTNEGATFETLMQDLDVGLLGTMPEPDPAAPPAPATTPVVATGHLRLGHRTRRGDTSQAWYRGPFVPHPGDREQPVAGAGGAVRPSDRQGAGRRWRPGAQPPQQDGALSVAHSADQLRRIVPDGREDLSHAAAFEIGRLLALSQLSVTTALLRFRQEQFGAARLRQVIADVFPWVLDDLTATRDLGHLVSSFFVDQVARQPVSFAGPPRPVADPGRPIEELAGLSGSKLDSFVAAGFGIDLQRLSKASKAVGVPAALAETDVPVVAADGVSEQAFTAVQEGLTAEVLRLAEMAMPDLRMRTTPARAPSGRARSGAQARRARDALDELLDAVELDAVEEES